MTVYPGVTDETPQEPHLRDYLAVLQRRRRWVLGIFALVVGLAGWVTYRATPVFEVHTTMRIESPESEAPILSDLAALQRRSPIATEIQMLESRSLAEDVVRELGLNVQLIGLDGPVSLEWKDRLLAGFAHARTRRTEVIDSVSVTSEVDPGSYVLEREKGSWRARQGSRILATAAAGQPLEFAGVRLRPRAATGSGEATIVIGVARLRDAVDSFLRKLDVSVPIREAEVVRVTYRDPDPELARAAVDAVAAKFIAQSFLANKSQARSTREFIEAQLAELSLDLERREEELQRYKERADVVALPAEAEHALTSYASFEAERQRFAAERDALGSLMDGLRTTGGDGAGDVSSYPSFIESSAIQQLKAQHNELAASKAKLLTEKTPSHPDVVAVQEQMDQVRASLESSAQGYRTALSSRIQSLDRSLGGLRRKLEGLPEKETLIVRLVREQQVKAQQYGELQMKLKEAQIAEAVELASMRVIDPALTPERPVKPKKRFNLMVGALLGLLLGCGAAFAREYFDNTLRTKEHAERELNLPILGVIPVLRVPGGRTALPSGEVSGPAVRSRSPAHREAAVENGGRHPSNGNGGPLLLTRLPPYSAGAEAYRALRTNLALLPLDAARGGHRAVLITSPGAGDGKTLVAANLAISCAQQGSRTMLVDTDLRKSAQHRLFGVERRKGLADYLLGRASLKEIVRETGIRRLCLIPSGATPPLPCELLDSGRMDQLLARVAPHVDILILDSPPVLPVADAVVLSRKVDDVLLVIRSGLTDKAAAADALAQLGGPDANRVTGVLNAMDYTQVYGHGYYSHYYAPYYSDSVEEQDPDWSWDVVQANARAEADSAK